MKKCNYKDNDKSHVNDGGAVDGVATEVVVVAVTIVVLLLTHSMEQSPS